MQVSKCQKICPFKFFTQFLTIVNYDRKEPLLIVSENLFPRGIVFIAAKRFSCINLLANSLRRNYETSLISADPLYFDLRPVMAVIISCGFVQRIITIHAVENSAVRYHGEHVPWSAVISLRYIKETYPSKLPEEAILINAILNSDIWNYRRAGARSSARSRS